MGAKFGYGWLNLDGLHISAEATSLVAESVARENVVIPVSIQDDGSLVVAISDPTLDFESLDKVRFIIDRENYRRSHFQGCHPQRN